VKSDTDLHWNRRAETVKDDIEVNIMDVFQRELEYDHVCAHLNKDMTVLEAGCGNGFSTRRFRELSKQVDAFDYAEAMIERAKRHVGETNNRFFIDNILRPQNIQGFYDAVISVRVLINLRDLAEQQLAVSNLAGFVREGGLLILVEGYREGFEALSELRIKVGLPALVPASINHYTRIDDILAAMPKTMRCESSFHLGSYDYLTRVQYPLMVGAENVTHNSVFAERSVALARAFNPPAFEPLSRIRGLVLRRLKAGAA
jgi:SAM-dependent methyltransferase